MMSRSMPSGATFCCSTAKLVAPSPTHWLGISVIVPSSVSTSRNTSVWSVIHTDSTTKRPPSSTVRSEYTNGSSQSVVTSPVPASTDVRVPEAELQTTSCVPRSHRSTGTSHITSVATPLARSIEWRYTGSPFHVSVVLDSTSRDDPSSVNRTRMWSIDDDPSSPVSCRTTWVVRSNT